MLIIFTLQSLEEKKKPKNLQMVFHLLSLIFREGMNWQLEVHTSSDFLTQIHKNSATVTATYMFKIHINSPILSHIYIVDKKGRAVHLNTKWLRRTNTVTSEMLHFLWHLSQLWKSCHKCAYVWRWHTPDCNIDMSWEYDCTAHSKARSRHPR